MLGWPGGLLRPFAALFSALGGLARKQGCGPRGRWVYPGERAAFYFWCEMKNRTPAIGLFAVGATMLLALFVFSPATSAAPVMQTTPTPPANLIGDGNMESTSPEVFWDYGDFGESNGRYVNDPLYFMLGIDPPPCGSGIQQLGGYQYNFPFGGAVHKEMVTNQNINWPGGRMYINVQAAVANDNDAFLLEIEIVNLVTGQVTTYPFVFPGRPIFHTKRAVRPPFHVKLNI